MKVLILTEGGGRAGLGHVSRCLAIYQACRERKINAELLINGDKSVDRLLKGAKYHKLNWLKNRKKLFENFEESVVVVIDSYLAPESLYYDISGRVRARLIMIDDFNRLDYPPGTVVNPSLRGDISGYSEKSGRKYLSGRNYIILRREFWKVPDKRINSKVRNVLLTFGGGDHQSFTVDIMHRLQDKFCFKFCAVNRGKGRITAKKMLAHMLWADICISGGGQTIHELVRVGVPTIAVCFADNQKFNLKIWSDKGVITYIGDHDSPGLFARLCSAMDRLLPQQRRLVISRRGKSCMRGYTMKKFTDYIIKNYEDKN